MNDSMGLNAQDASTVARPAKRRKFYRKRDDAEETEASGSSAHPVLPELQTVDELISQNGNSAFTSNPIEDEDGSLSVADIIRQRKIAQRRRGGIEFSIPSTTASAPSTPQPVDALVEREDEIPEDLKRVVSRFAPQTGQVSESIHDKHMYVCPSILPPGLRYNY